MLLRHDSLEYATTYLADAFPGSVGVGVGSPHEKSGRKCLFSYGAILPIQLPSPQDNTCIIGFLHRLETNYPGVPVVDNSPFMDFSSLGGSLKVRAKIRTKANSFSVVFYSGDGNSVILSSPNLPYNTWTYLETKVVFQQSQGSIVFRADGIEIARVENVTTDPLTIVPWGSVTLYLQTSLHRIADLYVCDGSGSEKTYKNFLGKILGTRLAPFNANTKKFEWGPNPNLGSKYRIVCMLGQSNMQGLGEWPLILPQPWRSTNPHLPIWNAVSGQFEPLSAGVNSSGIYTTNPRWGLEMMFAERLAQLIEASGSATASNFRLVKAAQDGSTVLSGFSIGNPSLPNFITWDPGTPNSLYVQFVQQLQLAVAALGGIGNVSQIDYLWYQGETEGILSLGLVPYPGDYLTQTINILLGMYSLFPIPSNLHIVQIHKSIAEEYAGGEVIRSRQRILRDVIPSSSFLDVDYGVTVSDGLHLSNPSLNNVGEQFFSEWIQYQQFGDFLKDEYFYANVDDIWIGSNSVGKKAAFSQVSSFRIDSLHAPNMAATSRMYLGSGIDGKSLRTSVGDTIITESLMASTPDKTQVYKGTPLLVSPEELSGDIVLELF